ncbi:hypothetical protein Mterra_00476 [Calidithermus terrae]|uniref:Fibronectin type-III domain-containing protein n=1 Tax=Calidithermus terrae TaxID=1408545 RepID=A0A399F2G6_9DEIN|nr:galactose oxidase-like domain-containing protein [Calidithermus terrae]RIH90408.1 hypothetical protein Mterra_00476 [Calidithermus terrae]
MNPGKMILLGLAVVLAACAGPDPAPAKPAVLEAITLSERQVRLSWPAAAHARAYEIERSTAGGAYEPLAQGAATAYVDSTVAADQRYSYRVRALNWGGASGWAESGAVITPPKPTPRAHLEGVFGTARSWPLVATHAVLLPDGTLMSWYSQDAIGNHRDNTDPIYHTGTRVDLWNPRTLEHRPANNSTTDLLCVGHVVLSDGRLFAAGGNLGGTNGSDHTNYYDPARGAWARGPDMAAGRWYPTLTLLPNEEVLITGGSDAQGKDNPAPEVLQRDGTLRLLSNARTDTWDLNHWYPWMFVTPTGRVFHAGSSNRLRFLEPAGQGAWGEGYPRDGKNRWYGSAVMYQAGKILVIGGGGPDATTTLLDVSADGEPGVRPGPSMRFGRTHFDATLLADGRVFVNGGNDGEKFSDEATVYDSEIWDPQSNAWAPGARASVPRNYHSTALLLPDGTVWTAGGGGCGEDCGVNHPNYEIYYPPYLFEPDGSGRYARRPSLTGAPRTLGYGQRFTLQSPDAPSIASVSLVALGAATHGFNMNQRFMKLTLEGKGSATLEVRAPASPNLAPPGFYLLFILDGRGVPSVGEIVRLE